MTNCVPFPSGSDPFSAQLKDRQTAESVLSYEGGCVVCKDGKPVAFPSFQFKFTVFAFGTFQTSAGSVHATSNVTTGTVNLSNNPHPYVPPCP